MNEESFAAKVARLQHEIAVRQAELSDLVLGDPRKSVTIEPCVTCKGEGYVKEFLQPPPADKAVRWKRCPTCKSHGSLLEASLVNAHITVDQYWSDRGYPS